MPTVPKEIEAFVNALTEGPLKSLERYLEKDVLFYRAPQELTDNTLLNCATIYFPRRKSRTFNMIFRAEDIDRFYPQEGGFTFALIVCSLIYKHLFPVSNVESVLHPERGVLSFTAEFEVITRFKVKRVSKKVQAIIDATQASTKNHDI